MNRTTFCRRFASPGLTAGICLLFAVYGLSTRARSSDESPPATLTVMTYNLKFASPKPPNAWPVRRPLMRELIRQVGPDEAKQRIKPVLDAEQVEYGP